MHSNWRMLYWGGIPGDTGICRIAWKGWKVMNDWNVSGVIGVTGVTGVTGVAFGRTCGWNAWNVL